MDNVKELWREQSSKLLEIEEQRKVFLDDENELVYERNHIVFQDDTVSAAINLNDDGRPDIITQEMAHTIGLDYDLISTLKSNKTLKEKR